MRIELQDTSVALNGRAILHELNWKLEPGQNWVVAGENGAGKSTFLRLLAGLIWPIRADSRRYQVDGYYGSSPLRARESVRLLSPETQERYIRQLRDGVDHETGWKLDGRAAVLTGFFGSELLHQRPDAAQEKRADQIIAQLGIENLAARNLETLSQGELRKVLLARALVSHPQLVLLDESCAGLDAAARETMLQIIQTVAQSGTQVIMTTHRAEEMVPAISDVLELEEGRIRQKSERNKVWSVSFNPSLVKENVLQPARQIGETLIELQNVSVFYDETPVLQNLNWQWRAGQHWAIAGKNGAGKSTFLKLLRGEVWPAWGGKIARFGKTHQSREEIGEQIALLSPELQARYSDQLPVEDAVASGFFQSLGRVEPLSSEQHERVKAVMAQTGLESLSGRQFGRLSYGQTRKVLLARALVNAPRVLLLDEPFDGLDKTAREEWRKILEQLAPTVSIALVSHHESDWPDFLTDFLRL